jgi:hypothetical protein
MPTEQAFAAVAIDKALSSEVRVSKVAVVT